VVAVLEQTSAPSAKSNYDRNDGFIDTNDLFDAWLSIEREPVQFASERVSNEL
jgi:hypothetical protein